MEEFLELVPGVPLTQEVRDTLTNSHQYINKPKVWSFYHKVTKRAVRQNGAKVIKEIHNVRVLAYCANLPLPDYMLLRPPAVQDDWRMQFVWDWEGETTDIVPKLMEAKAIIKRLEAGEICSGCNKALIMPRCRVCKDCSVRIYMRS